MHAKLKSIWPSGETLWEATASSGSNLSSMIGSHQTDVAVVGAGIAGLSTALHLAQAGKSVVVLDAGQPGDGATGQSGGLIAPDFVKHGPVEIEQALGQKRGGRLRQMVGSSARQCFEIIEALGIDCDAKQEGFWIPAHDTATMTMLTQRASEWRQFGFDVECVSAERTMAEIGATKYVGAIRFAQGGSLNPLAYCRGLAKSAVALGAELFCASQVQKIERCLNGWRLSTKQGNLDAKRVVLAANGGNAALHPQLQKTILPLGVYEYATEPLSAEIRAEILPAGAAFTDKQSYLFTARYDREGRLVAAFPDFFVRRSTKNLIGEAKRRLVEHFPLTEPVSIEFLWHGTAWLNSQLLPKIFGLEDGVFAIQACNGRGLAINSILGKEMAAALVADDMSLLSLQPEPAVAIPAHRLAKSVPSTLMAMAFLKSRLGW